jgi:hypothetical protein
VFVVNNSPRNRQDFNCLNPILTLVAGGNS